MLCSMPTPCLATHTLCFAAHTRTVCFAACVLLQHYILCIAAPTLCFAALPWCVLAFQRWLFVQNYLPSPPPPPPPSSFPSSPPSPTPFPPFPFAACLPCFASIMWARLGGPMLLRKNIMDIVNRWLDFSKKNWGSKHHHVIIQRGLHRRLYWMHMTALNEWLVITTTSPLAYLLRIQMSTRCSRSMHSCLSIMLAMLCSMSMHSCLSIHTLQQS